MSEDDMLTNRGQRAHNKKYQDELVKCRNREIETRIDWLQSMTADRPVCI